MEVMKYEQTSAGEILVKHKIASIP